MARKKENCRCSPDALSALNLFQVLAEPNRAKIMEYLMDCCAPRTVSDVSGCCPVDFSVVSRHLAALKDAGILTSEKKGRKVFYFIRTAPVVAALRSLADAIENCCPAEPAEKEKRHERKRKNP
jgi:ArsR family transcriptional regulator, arsenate/arsenite/antimonite-responsive transcriptional repressor